MSSPSWLPWVRSDSSKKSSVDNSTHSRKDKSKLTSSTAVSTTSDHDGDMSTSGGTHSRRNRRRLQRTRSASDIIREMANERDSSRNGKSVAASDSATPRVALSKMEREAHVAASASVATDHPGSVSNASHVSDAERFMAGFFGSRLVENPSLITQESQSKTPSVTNKYLNETAFMQQFDQRNASKDKIVHASKVDHAHSLHTERHRRSASVGSFRPQNPLESREQRYSQGGSSLEGQVYVHPEHSRERPEHRYLHPDHLRQRNEQARPFPHFGFLPHPFFAGEPERECSHCTGLKSQLAAAFADTEYLRKIALRKEYVCSECEVKAGKSSTTAIGPPTTAHAASKQLIEVISRHKKQVEQLMKERIRWQQDMQFKLNKFANLCKDLNEEATFRNEECRKVKNELEQVTRERDELSMEILLLRAQVESHEKERISFEEIKRKCAEYEENGIRSANEIIQAKEDTIADLVAKLETVLDQLEAERHKNTAS